MAIKGELISNPISIDLIIFSTIFYAKLF